MLRRPPGSAFTLIELLTVITIIGILAGIVIGVGRRAGESGREARAKVELAAITTALESYKRQYGDYPRTNSGAALLQALVGKIDPKLQSLNPQGRVLLDLALFTTDNEGDPLSNSLLLLVDPWEQPYHYVYKPTGMTWTNPSYVIYSRGPDEAANDSLLNGGYPNRNEASNLDNIYAFN
jgi:general secretion pathway protein G